MITFNNWVISNSGLIAYQFDNLSAYLEITGNIPPGWTWNLYLQAGSNLNIVSLTETENGIGVELTAEMLALSGNYYIQLQGTQGDVVKHTNIIQVYIPNSLSGNVQWPTVPSEFTQIEQRIQTLNSNPPYPGDNGYWMIYDIDSGSYIQSSLPLPPVAEGPPGKDATIIVGETTTGQPGTPASVVNTGTGSAAVLNFTIPAGQKGDPGAAATVAVGETVTGAPGTEASVENVGTSSAAVLRFTIPAGATGATPDISVEVTGLPGGSEPTVSVSGTPEAPVISLGIPAGQKGDPGEPGQTPNITIGTVETLAAGSSVTASITGNTPNLVLNLGIPKGQQGDPGEAATVTVGTTTTGAPGSQASVANSGTANAAVLNFTIPAGEAGAGVPSTEGVPTNYVLTPGGWAAPDEDPDFFAEFTVEEAVSSYVISDSIDPSEYSFFLVHIFDGPSDTVSFRVSSDGFGAIVEISNAVHQITFVFLDNSNDTAWKTHGAITSLRSVAGSTVVSSSKTYFGGSSAFPQGIRLDAASELPAGMICRIKGWK